MASSSERDVFAHINDEIVTNAGLRAERLGEAKRGFAPIRKVFVQRPKTEARRPSILGTMVNKRMRLPLRTLLLVYALEPLLADARWPLAIWARLIAGTGPVPSIEAVSNAFTALQNLKLITRTNVGKAVVVRPLLEDGSGADYTRPTAKGAAVGPGYLTVPHEYWNSGLADQLKLPGTAMFLVALHETTREATYQISLEQMQGWYGISERTAERGYLELGEPANGGILMTKTQWVRDPKMRQTNGLRPAVHRALKSPYSQAAREELQAKSSAAARAAAASSQP
ncbi:hypothetical protein [Promicromonospora sukumoe]|uniref:hypothetical protein n=1 Tax=Promicromonospora sukumoe TaxID=88382 RepID=UPI00365A972D